MKRYSLLIPGAALLLSACASVGPDYVAPPGPASANWLNHVATDAAVVPSAAWWQGWHDPVLERLIQEAIRANPDVKTAMAKIRAARAQVTGSQAAEWPSVSASGGAKRTWASEDAGGKIGQTYSASLDASWEVDIWGAGRRAIEAAQANQQALEASLQDVQVTLVADVANAYINLRAFEQQLLVTQRNLQMQEETLQITRWRQQAGLVTELDVAQASRTLEQTRSGMPTLETSLENSRNQLAVLLGREPAAVRPLLVGGPGVPWNTQALQVGLPSEVLRQRPDVRVAERQLAAQTAKIGQAEAALYPTLNLSASALSSVLLPRELLRGSTIAESLAGGLTLPLLNAASIRQNIETQKAVREQNLAAYEKTVLQALADVENALVALQKNQERLDILGRSLADARLADTLAKQRYAAGLIDFLTVQDAEQTRLSVDNQIVVAEAARAQALIQLYKALGGGWPVEPANKGEANGE